MQKRGFEAVAQAFLPYFPISGEIYPPLDELDDEGQEYSHRHIEINVGEHYHTQDVVETLETAGLLEGSLHRDKQPEDMPLLRIIGIMPGRILFEDLTHQI